MDIITLILITFSVFIALGALAPLLRLATRWVLGCWVKWGQTFKTVLIAILASFILQLLLGVTLAVYYQNMDEVMLMMETSPGLNLIMFLLSMLVQGYIYGHWLSCDEFNEAPGLGKGLLIFWAQVLILLGLMMLVALGMFIFVQ